MSGKYKIELSEDRSIEITVADDGSLTVDGVETDVDAVKVGPETWSVIMDNKSYNVTLQSFDMNQKALVIKVNDEEFRIRIQDELDALLDKMGMSGGDSSKMGDVQAPMPGLVLEIIAKEGQAIQKGDPLIVLEAMKMENVIKATGDGTISKILVSNQDAVEKNQVLIEME